jgi:hypothetical protein
MLSNLNIYFGHMFGSKFYFSDVIGIAFYFSDVCGLAKKASEIFYLLVMLTKQRLAL